MENDKKVEMPEKAQVQEINVEKNIGDSIISVAETIMSEKDYSDDFSREDMRNYKEFAIVSYIPFVVLYLLYKKEYKKTDYLKFHVNQGLLLTIAWFLVIVISIVLRSIFIIKGLFIIKLPFVISLINYILYSFVVLLTAFGIINTSRKLSKKLPIIGNIRIIK